MVSAVIQQIADTNFAVITQARASRCGDTIIQKGMNEYATIFDSAVSSSAYINQGNGKKNRATIQHTSIAHSVINQKGNSNNTSIKQEAPSDHIFHATVLQEGDRNISTIQSADAEVKQIGSDNESKIIARHTFDPKNIQGQHGSYNSASINQDQVSGNLSLNQSQTGNYDTATIVQTNTSGSSVSQTQIGDYNKAVLNQSDGSSFATQWQSGSHNTAILTQQGNGHSAEQEQSGSGYYSTITQKGEANIAVSRQRL
jgi:hypothetical protein